MINQITVTGDIGKWKKGDILTDRDEIAYYYLTIANEDTNNPSDLISISHERILACIDAVDGDSEDAEIERVELITRLNSGVL